MHHQEKDSVAADLALIASAQKVESESRTGSTKEPKHAIATEASE